MKKRFPLVALIILIGITNLAVSCERDRNGDPIELFVRNNSSDTIIAGVLYNYPDTSLVESYNTLVLPDSESKFWAFTGWKHHISRLNPQKTLTMIIYDYDTFRKYSFEHIKQNYMIRKRYVLTIEELKAMNWKVTYP